MLKQGRTNYESSLIGASMRFQCAAARQGWQKLLSSYFPLLLQIALEPTRRQEGKIATLIGDTSYCWFLPPPFKQRKNKRRQKFRSNFRKIFIGQSNSRKSRRSLPKGVCEELGDKSWGNNTLKNPRRGGRESKGEVIYKTEKKGIKN